MQSLDKMIESICTHSGQKPEAVKKLIEEKQDELSGLVTPEGAAYMVARELGVSLLKETRRQLKVKSLVDGLRSVDLVARVVRVFEPRDFEKNGKKGSVMNVLVGDETGVVRLSLWNQEIDKFKELGVSEGDTLRVNRGYMKLDNRDNPELRIGKGSLEKLDQKMEVEIPETKRIEEDFTVAKRKDIKDFKEGELGEARGCLVQIFRRNPFFEVCPNCGVRVKNVDGKWTCDDHGVVEPEYQIVISGVLDDGTENIRVVFFRELAEKVFGKTAKELREMFQKESDGMVIYDHFEGLGKEIIIKGRVKVNDFTQSKEFVANEVLDLDIKKECEDLISELAE